MVKTYHNELKSVPVLHTVTCDVCRKAYDTDDWEEIQEFLYIDFSAGYGSIFGDLNKVQADVCQHCLKEKLGPFLQIINYQWMSQEELIKELSEPLTDQ